MSADLIRYEGQPSLPDMVRYAEHLAQSGMLPKAFVGRPANVLYAMEYGRTLSITPIAAITGIHVIEGKPTASAALISALVRRAGHKLRVTGNDQKAVATIVRADDPDFEYRSEWDLNRAQQAGLCTLRDGRPIARTKDGDPKPWEKYPAAMLKARAITEVARDACEEALFGLHYTPEELGAVVDQDGNPVDAPVQPLRPVASQVIPASESVVPPEQKAAEDAAAATDPQVVRELYAAAREQQLLTATVISPLGTMELGEYLIARGEQLTSTTKNPPGDEITDAEVVPDSEEGEHAAAVAELRAAAETAGLTPADLAEGFEAQHGLSIDQASAAAIRETTKILKGAA